MRATWRYQGTGYLGSLPANTLKAGFFLLMVGQHLCKVLIMSHLYSKNIQNPTNMKSCWRTNTAITRRKSAIGLMSLDQHPQLIVNNFRDSVLYQRIVLGESFLMIMVTSKSCFIIRLKMGLSKYQTDLSISPFVLTRFNKVSSITGRWILFV